VQRELKTFDFRPDLTRRSEKCRWYEVEGEQHLTQYTRIESIANDVAVNYKTLTRLPRLAQTAIESLCFMQFANQYSEFSEYLLAAAACGASVSISKKLIQSAARWYHRSLNNSWDRRSDNERMVLMVSFNFIVYIFTFTGLISNIVPLTLHSFFRSCVC